MHSRKSAATSTPRASTAATRTNASTNAALRHAWMAFGVPDSLRPLSQNAVRARSADGPSAQMRFLNAKQDSAVVISDSAAARPNVKKEDLPFQRTDEERELNPERINMNRKELKTCVQLPSEDRLRLLNYQSNFITRIENLDNLKNLVFLDFFNNSIEKIENLDNLPNLRVLMLGRNRIQRIQGLETALKLDVLDLHSNQISKIENIMHLVHLRVLNLEDNAITHMERLPAAALSELNLKRNQITRITGVHNLAVLKRLILAQNHVNAFDPIVDLLQSPSLIELSLEGNPISQDPYYRLILVNRIKTLKHLDGKRVSEEEKRTAHRIARRETERRRDTERAAGIAEERRNAVECIEARWQNEMEAERKKERGFVDYVTVVMRKEEESSGKSKKAKNSRFEKPEDSKAGGLMYVENTQMFMFGIDSLALCEKADISSIIAVNFQYIDISKLCNTLTKLKRATELERITFSHNNINSLKKLDLLSAISLAKPLAVVIENNTITSSPFFFHYTLFRLCRFSHPNVIKSLNGIDITPEMVDESMNRYGILRCGLLKFSTQAATESFQRNGDAPSQTDEIIQRHGEIGNITREQHAASASYVDKLLKDAVETRSRLTEFEEVYPALILKSIEEALAGAVE